MEPFSYIAVGLAVATLVFLIISVLSSVLSSSKLSGIIVFYSGLTFLTVGILNMVINAVYFGAQFFRWYFHAVSQIF